MRLVEKAFLIKIDADHFVKAVDGNEVTTSTVPSACPAMDYAEADSIARLLRKRKYFANAYVSDLTGQPITGEMLRVAQLQAQEEESLPKDHAELDAISVPEQRRRYAQSAAFRQRWHELEAQPRTPKKAVRR